MILSHNGYRYELHTGYGESVKAQKAGFSWDETRRIYYTSQGAIAKSYIIFADQVAQHQLRQFEKKLVFSEATDADIDVPSPEGMMYLGFQKAGVLFASQRQNTLIGDEMRLGKSVQSIGLINYDTSINRVLIIPPATLNINWSRELTKWLTRSLSIDIATSTSLPTSDIVIANYEIIKKLRKDILKRGTWDAIICDEAHYLQNPFSQRTSAILGSEYLGKQTTNPLPAQRRLFLTGTPMLNSPVNLWPMLRACDPEGLGYDFWAYTKRYCGGWNAPWGWDATGATHLDELRDRLRGVFMIRRLRRTVLPQLPKKRRQIIQLPLPDKLRALIRAEAKLFEAQSAPIENARREAEQAQAVGDETSYRKAVAKLSQAEELVFENMSTARKETAIAKIPYATSLLDNVLLEQDKVVVFAHHREVVEKLAAYYGKAAVLLYGEMTPLQKQTAVDRFKDDPKVKVFVGSIIPCIGFSLSVSDYGLCVEYDWRPLIMSQAEDRMETLDRTTSLLIQHLVFDQSIDVVQVRTLIKKQEIADTTLD